MAKSASASQTSIAMFFAALSEPHCLKKIAVWWNELSVSGIKEWTPVIAGKVFVMLLICGWLTVIQLWFGYILWI